MFFFSSPSQTCNKTNTELALFLGTTGMWRCSGEATKKKGAHPGVDAVNAKGTMVCLQHAGYLS